ncbi:MAG: hypothetical protein FD180_1124 [Planctomycetota bacterium]|nr:MAG: hypothetical protein FD180_1124 [Planctomycetota bacterium]
MTRFLLRFAPLAVLSGCFMPYAEDAGIRTTQSEIRKTVVFAAAALGEVNALTLVSSNGMSQIVVGGQAGAAFLDLGYVQERFVRFSYPGLSSTVPVDVEGDGRYGFMDRECGLSATVLSSEAALLWSFPPKDDADYDRNPNQMAAGDLDGDGDLEFVVGAGGGIYAFDKAGSMIWQADASLVFAVEIADLDEDGKLEVVHLDEPNKIVIRDGKGEEIRRFDRPAGLHGDPLLWRNEKGGYLAIGNRGDVMHVLDLSGKEITTLELSPEHGYFNSVRPMRIEGRTCYAASTKLSYCPGIGYLYLFDERGTIIHEEVFKGRVDSMLTFPEPGRTNSDILLIGVETQVIEYRWLPAESR